MSKIQHILSAIHYTICGAVCFQFTHYSCDDWENIYTLSYCHHQIGSMNYYPLFRVRSWINGARCMSFYILILILIGWNNGLYASLGLNELILPWYCTSKGLFDWTDILNASNEMELHLDNHKTLIQREFNARWLPQVVKQATGLDA